MNKIYCVEAGIDYEGSNVVKAFASEGAAEAFAAYCRAYLSSAIPYVEYGCADEEYLAWRAADEAWEKAGPYEDFSRHLDYFTVSEVEFVVEQQ